VEFEDFLLTGFARCWQHVGAGLDFADSSDATLGTVSRSKVQQHQAGPARVAIIRYAIKPTRIMTFPKGHGQRARLHIYYRLRSKENQCEQPRGRRTNIEAIVLYLLEISVMVPVHAPRLNSPSPHSLQPTYFADLIAETSAPCVQPEVR